jgi:hypothetical protein
MDPRQSLPVVVGRDVNMRWVESDLTDTKDVDSNDPPATYTRSSSFHETEVPAVKLSSSRKSETRMLTAACDPTIEFCNPVLFLESILRFTKESAEKCPDITTLSDECSQSDSKDTSEDLLIDSCNMINRSQRGRFLVWPSN